MRAEAVPGNDKEEERAVAAAGSGKGDLLRR